MDHAMKYPQSAVERQPYYSYPERACLARLTVLVAGIALFSACAGEQRRPTETITASTLLEMRDEINSGKKVRLAVVGFASTSASKEFLFSKGIDMTQWRANATAATVGIAERTCLRFFRKHKNFIMVDRSTLGAIRDELVLSDQPDFDEGMRLKIGKLTGANYILIARMAIVPGGPKGRPGWHNEYNFRLIKTENGRLLAIDTWNEWQKK